MANPKLEDRVSAQVLRSIPTHILHLDAERRTGPRSVSYSTQWLGEFCKSLKVKANRHTTK